MNSDMALALLTLFIGVTTTWVARYVYRELRINRRWPTVPGKILERGVGDPLPGMTRVYLPIVKYSYSVGGRDYTNDQVYLIRKTGNLAPVIRQLVDSLPDPVPVHYDPQDPSRSYLLVNPMQTVWVIYGFAALAIILGLLRLLVIWTKEG
jgi:hypothetical protein